MKVEGPSKSSSVKGASKAGASKSGNGAAFRGFLGGQDEVAGSGAVGGAGAITQLDSLLAMQEAMGGASEESNKKAKKRADDLLSKLDELRDGILSGDLEPAVLHDLAHIVSLRRDQADPALMEALDDIDLRVQVELAKFGRI